jgi:hypothetical protein
VTGESRSVIQPRVPTAKEAGVTGLVASSWNALAAPAGTPPAVINRLHREIVAALPGRAGGGEELGGRRALAFYLQRVALQGSRPLVQGLAKAGPQG